MPSSLIVERVLVDDDWLTAREAGALARVAPKTLANWRSLGIGPPYTKLGHGPGGRIRYARRDVAEFIASQLTGVA